MLGKAKQMTREEVKMASGVNMHITPFLTLVEMNRLLMEEEALQKDEDHPPFRPSTLRWTMTKKTHPSHIKDLRPINNSRLCQP